MTMTDNLQCYCQSGQLFKSCCAPFINQQKLPTTAEQLMRSRYSAYNSNNAAYIVHTHLPVKPETLTAIQSAIDETQWLGLKILKTQAGLIEDNEGEVEFIAFYQDQGIKQLHECSRFIKQAEQWFYLDGIQLPPIKLARNDSCFCGSGKKYKKCHALIS